MRLNKLKDAPIKDKRVLLRLELNVPLDKGRITDNTRIIAAIPTIRAILKKRPKQLIIMSHLGRPDARWINRLSMNRVASALEKKLGRKITFFAKDIRKADQLPEKQIIFLENIRFYRQEKGNDRKFAKMLAKHADLFINDAFGTLHRKHASVNAITYCLQSFAGLLIEKEVKTLSRLRDPKRPYLVIIGGGKADKLKTIEKMSKRADNMIVGGVSANMLLRAMGKEVGNSIIDKKFDLLAKRLSRNKCLNVPIDVVIGKKPGASTKVVAVDKIPKDMMILDMGPKTIRLTKNMIKKAKTIFWAGPLGWIEYSSTRKASSAIAKALANSSAFTVIGGGDSALAAHQAKVVSKIDHISTGGGASLQFVEEDYLISLRRLEKK